MYGSSESVSYSSLINLLLSNAEHSSWSGRHYLDSIMAFGAFFLFLFVLVHIDRSHCGWFREEGIPSVPQERKILDSKDHLVQQSTSKLLLQLVEQLEKFCGTTSKVERNVCRNILASLLQEFHRFGQLHSKQINAEKHVKARAKPSSSHKQDSRMLRSEKREEQLLR